MKMLTRSEYNSRELLALRASVQMLTMSEQNSCELLLALRASMQMLTMSEYNSRELLLALQVGEGDHVIDETPWSNCGCCCGQRRRCR